MRVADLFESSTETPSPTSGARARRPARRRPTDPHYRLAMRAAREVGRAPRRENAEKLVCHHLRAMLDAPAAPGPARRRPERHD